MIYLAPIHGYTDYTFRNVYTRYFNGIDIAMAPFVPLVDGKQVKPIVIRDILPENNEGTIQIVPQVMGYKPAQFILMARTLEQLGYASVNWNLGCPMRRIARKKRGSGLLPYPEIIEKTLSEVIPKIHVKLSVKVRLGYYEKDELFRLIPVLNRFPLDYVIVHPRIGTQLYDGSVDLDSYERCLNMIQHPVIYNGDITSRGKYAQLKHKFPETSGWMIGRGVLTDFYLPARIQGWGMPSMDVRRNHMIRFHTDFLTEMEKRWGKETALLNKIKEQWLNFSEMYIRSEEIFMKLRLINHYPDMKNLILDVVENEMIRSVDDH